MRWTQLPEFALCPNNWEVVHLLNKAKFVAGQSPDSDLYNTRGEGTPFLQGNADFGSVHPSPTVFCVAPTKFCETGDALISVRAPVGALNRADQIYGLGRGVGALHPTEIDADYLYHAMTRWHLPLKRAAQGSTFDAVTARHFRQLKCCLPKSKDEQKAIAERLNLADATLAAAQAKLTAACRLKTALMQQLFTRGIPGQHKQFKQTKIGKVPVSWEIVSIENVLDGVPFNGISPQSQPEPPGTPILNVACVDSGLCTTKYVSYVDIEGQTIKDCWAKQGDFYVLRGNGNREYAGTGGYLAEEPKVPTLFSDKLIRLRFQESEVVARFIPYLWQSSAFLRRFQSKAESGSGLWMVSKRDIRKEIIALPTSKNEQQDIVALIDASIATIAECENELRALDRLKRSLLQNLLTGKVRVNATD